MELGEEALKLEKPPQMAAGPNFNLQNSETIIEDYLIQLQLYANRLYERLENKEKSKLQIFSESGLGKAMANFKSRLHEIHNQAQKDASPNPRGTFEDLYYEVFTILSDNALAKFDVFYTKNAGMTRQ
jgi:hypothetical protein